MKGLRAISVTGVGLALVFLLSGCAGLGMLLDGETTHRTPGTSRTSPTIQQETQRIGEVGIGFVDVPADYIEFIEIDGGDDLQYSDITGTDIFTLNVIDRSSLDEDFTLNRGAENLAAKIQNDGASDVKITRTELDGHNALQIYGTYPEGITLVMTIVADDEGNVHYISVESPNLRTIDEMLTLVEETYAFDA